MQGMREMQVAAVGVDAGTSTPVVLLREVATRHRMLPVWVGHAEAEAIEIERRRLAMSRPPTHHLIANVLDFCGRRLEHVCVTAVHDGVVHAELVIDADVRLSARVSDAVAVALHVGAPILATDLVLEQAALDDVVLLGDESEPAQRDEEAMAEMRRFLQDAGPDDFG